MEPTSSVDSTQLCLSQEDKQTLQQIASSSIDHGLRQRRALPVDVSQYCANLQTHRASFVTLRRSGELRGCIGVIEAARPLVEDVAHNAWSAAFRNPRFSPLKSDEVSDLKIHISILSVPEPIQFKDEQDLLRQVRPGTDGLLLEDPACKARGTFLPAVWQTLPDRDTFWQHLKAKAGLAPDYFSDTLVVMRYTTQSIS